MTLTRLYLAAYDVRDTARLRAALSVVRDFSSGGQYSAYECWMDNSDVDEIATRMCGVLDLSVDSFMLIPIQHRKPVATLGVAVLPADPTLYYVQ